MKYLIFLALLVTTFLVQAQDDEAFLACAQISDRNERLQCLDDALSDAVEKRDTAISEPPVTDEAPAVDTFGSNRADEAVDAPEETAVVDEEKRSFFRLPRIRNIFGGGDDEEATEEAEEQVVERSGKAEDKVESFGRETRVVVNEDGRDELHDTIAELYMAKPNQWLIRLGSGQVWRQTTPRRLNLKEGDEVKIYPTGWGDNYRLETARLSGFIQVLRVED